MKKDKNKSKKLTLSQGEYHNLCLLIIYGNLIADHLLGDKKAKPNSLQYAATFKNLAMEFKPFLQKNLEK